MTKIKEENAAINEDLLDPLADGIGSDRDGLIDLDPVKAQQTMIELVTLEHALRDHNSSLAQLLRSYARNSAGIRF